MIKPATLWGLFKTSDNSEWLGQICRYLGGQNIELDYGQKQIVAIIQQDSDWMDERIEWEREANRKRVARFRAQKKDKCNAYTDDVIITHPSNDVVMPSLPPSLPPSLHKKNNNSCCCTKSSSTSAPTKIHFEDDSFGHKITKANLGDAVTKKNIDNLISIYSKNFTPALTPKERQELVSYVLTRNEARQNGIGDQPIITVQNFHRTIRSWLKNLEKERKVTKEQEEQKRGVDDISTKRLSKDDDFSGED